ncbi:AAA family ATPase [Streptomyces mirabilis]|uniref:AAA family ATPase n=1 Tax=Streptomyces mirabilis TaxID=68239 RepID=UPI0033B93B0D
MRTRSVGKSWRKLLGSQQASAGLTLVTECPPLPQGGTEAIAQWLDRNPDARMVVIDVFAKMRGQAPQGVSAYNADDVPVGYAKRLADHYGIAVVIVHHVRKAGSDDFLTEVSGTNGIAGAADATLVLNRARGQADGILHVTGRDVDEAEYALSFQPASGAWHLLDGPVTDHTIGDTRATPAAATTRTPEPRHRAPRRCPSCPTARPLAHCRPARKELTSAGRNQSDGFRLRRMPREPQHQRGPRRPRPWTVDPRVLVNQVPDSSPPCRTSGRSTETEGGDSWPSSPASSTPPCGRPKWWDCERRTASSPRRGGAPCVRQEVDRLREAPRQAGL